jgi:hypothetical protein
MDPPAPRRGLDRGHRGRGGVELLSRGRDASEGGERVERGVRAADPEVDREAASAVPEREARARDEPVLDRFERDVRRLVAAEGHARPRVPGRLDAASLVVEVHDRGRLGAKQRVQLALRGRDPVQRVEELEVHRPDVGHHGDVGVGDARQEGDLARRAHPQLDHGPLRVVGAIEEAQRDPEVVVEVPPGPVHAARRAESRG